MAVNEYDCAQDLLGRDVSMVRRTGGLCVEVSGRVLGVRGSVCGRWDVGEVDVLWSYRGETEMFTFDLGKYCPEEVSE